MLRIKFITGAIPFIIIFTLGALIGIIARLNLEAFCSRQGQALDESLGPQDVQVGLDDYLRVCMLILDIALVEAED